MNASALDVIVSFLKSIEWGTWVPAIATVVLAVLTFIYVHLTKGILENQSNPCVIVSVIHDDERPTILQLVIKNVGAGLAQDITFDLSRPIPARAWGIAEKDAKTVGPMTSGPLIEGVPALGPGEQRRIDWGQYGGLTKNLGKEPVTVKCKFKKNGKDMPPMECKLDVKSFEGTVAAERPSAKAAKELEKISRDLHNLATGFYKLKIEMVEDQDFEPEEDKENKA
jgi:hypothetical protein